MDARARILLFLVKEQKSFYVDELVKELSLSKPTILAALRKLSSCVLVEEKWVGKEVSLIWNNDTKKFLTKASLDEKDDFLKGCPVAKRIADQANDMTLLHGDFLKNKKSNIINLFIINGSGKISCSFERLELLYNKKIIPVFVSMIEFKSMFRKKGDSVGRQILKNHIILHGSEDFWNFISA